MKIQLKRSSNLENYGQGNEAKRPSPDHMLYGELAVNFNTDDPAIFLKDSGDNIVRIAGAGSTSGNIPGGSTGERPGSGNSVGDLYFDTTLNTVLVWNGTQWVQLALNTVIADDTETNSPPDVTKYPAGTFWFNSSNTEAALYVLYDDPTPEQGKKWVQVAGGGMGLDEIETDLSGVFVKLAGNADPQVITGDGGLRTEGLLESEGGVSVTGNTTFASGLGKDSYDNLIIKNNSQPVIFIYPDGSVRNQSPTKQAFYATGGVDNNEANSKDVTSYAHYRGLNSGQICKNFIAYSASGDARGGTITGDGVGFEAALSLRSLGVRHIGFKGGLNNDTPDSYNFFAEENAPNFFKGDTYIGGKTARNTFELWRSTLTEEQLEQLQAGTLAIPETVSDPDNGFFARHWYYNQQDEETQALLDSGELKYPAQFAAETFTDEFDLGENTRINLLSNGVIESNSVRTIRPADKNQMVAMSATGSFNVIRASSSAESPMPFRIEGNAGTQQVRMDMTTNGSLQIDSRTRSDKLINIRASIDKENGSSDFSLTSTFGTKWTELDNVNRLVHYTAASMPSSDLDNVATVLDANTGFACAEISAAGRIAIETVGFRSGIAQLSQDKLDEGKTAYNFYAEGTAPNLFKGRIFGNLGAQFGDEDTSTTSDDKNGCTIGTATHVMARANNNTNPSLYMNRNSTVARARFIHFGRGTGTDFDLQGFIRQNGADSESSTGIEYCTDSSGTPAFVEIGDLRSRSYSDFESSASNVIKLLQPKRDGFVPHVLAQHVAQAVTGAENETEVVGIYTDVDGSVEYDVTEPETIPFGATWQQTGTRDVYQGVDQTKLIPLLTKALQEALERIEELESNTLQPLYSTVADLPDASAHHGKTAHVHSEGALYFAHGGNWVKLQNA